jgi:hypothetical protein
MPDAIEWVSHPAVRHPWRAVALAAIAVGASALVLWWTTVLLYALVSLVVLFGSTLSYFLPTRYRMDAEGIRISFMGTVRVFEWANVRGWTFYHDAMYVSTVPMKSGLSRYRGSLITFGEDREGVVAFFKAHVRENVG